jgi:hypothetical protein
MRFRDRTAKDRDWARTRALVHIAERTVIVLISVDWVPTVHWCVMPALLSAAYMAAARSRGGDERYSCMGQPPGP